MESGINFLGRLVKAAPETLGRLVEHRPYLLVILLSVSMFGGGLPGDRVWSPADILVEYYPWRGVIMKSGPANAVNTDIALQMNPWLVYASEQIKSGKLPLWNPHSFGGVPFHGNMISAVFSPFNVPAYLMPVQWALSIQPILKTAVAGLSMLWFLRLLGMAGGAALLGAVAFMFNGFIIVWLGAPESSVAVWMPLLFGATENLRQKGGWRAASTLAFAVFLQQIGGHPETSLHLLLAATAFAAWRSPGGGWAFPRRFLAALAVGVAMSAFQILPFLDYLSRSVIFMVRTNEAAVAVNSIRSFIALLVPDFFGNPVYDNYKGLELGLGNYHVVSGSVGVIPWLVAPLAFALRGRVRLMSFFALIAGASLLLVFDRVLLPGLLAAVPGYSLVAPATHRVRLVLAFALAVLAAGGLDALLTAPSNPGTLRRVKLVARGGLAFFSVVSVVSLAVFGRDMDAHGMVPFMLGQLGLFLGLAWLAEYFLIRRARLGGADRMAVPMLLAIAVTGIWFRVPSFNPVIKDHNFFPTTPAIDFIRRDDGIFRTVLPLPNVGMVYGITQVGGYDAMTPLRFRRLAGKEGGFTEFGSEPFELGIPLDSPLAALLNIKYVMEKPGGPSPGEGYVLDYEGRDGRVYRNTRVLPRAFLVNRHVRFRTAEEVRTLLRAGKIDPSREIVSMGKPGVTSYPADPEGMARIDLNEANRVVVATSSRTPAFLVLSDRYSPRWSVRVDGKPAEMMRVNYAFRGVKLAAGRHTVEFKYFPLLFFAGIGISAVALLFAVLMRIRGKARHNW